MKKEEALKHLREVFKWFQGQTQESLKTLLPEIMETEDNKFKQAIRLVLIATEDDQRAFYSTHGITRKECTDWLENRAVRDEKNVRKYIASLAFNLHAETDLPYEECVRFAIQLGEDLLGVADGTVESGISDEDLEDFENEKCVRLAAAEMEATKDKEHADEFLKSAGIMDKDGRLAEPYRNDIELGLDRALHIVEAARGKLDGYDTDDGIYECDYAIQVLSDFLDSKVWKPIKWNEEDENMLWTVINSLSDVTHGEERNWLAERLRYLVPEPREWDSNTLPENADDKTINEKLISLVNWSGTPWSTKDKDQFVAYLKKIGCEKYVPCDGQCENCACFQSGLHFQQEKKLEEEQKPQGVYVNCTEHPEWYGMPPKEQKPTATINGEPISTENQSVDIPLAEWSEEDEKMLKSAIWHISNSVTNGKNTDCKCDLTEWFMNKLKYLRPQPKPEWSEHDSEMRMKILKYLSTRCSVIEFEEVEDWLNELRLPWRPTWNQKEAVRNVLHPDDPYYIELNSLLSDLTKLYYGVIR